MMYTVEGSEQASAIGKGGMYRRHVKKRHIRAIWAQRMGERGS